jgi:hypothetical protein
VTNRLIYAAVVLFAYYSTLEMEAESSFETSANFHHFFSMALPDHSGLRPLIQFRNHFSQTVGLLGRVISPP